VFLAPEYFSRKKHNMIPILTYVVDHAPKYEVEAQHLDKCLLKVFSCKNIMRHKAILIALYTLLEPRTFAGNPAALGLGPSPDNGILR
jgi:hypothetical protein